MKRGGGAGIYHDVFATFKIIKNKISKDIYCQDFSFIQIFDFFLIIKDIISNNNKII